LRLQRIGGEIAGKQRVEDRADDLAAEFGHACRGTVT
jgi:hypothetical protein